MVVPVDALVADVLELLGVAWVTVELVARLLQASAAVTAEVACEDVEEYGSAVDNVRMPDAVDAAPVAVVADAMVAFAKASANDLLVELSRGLAQGLHGAHHAA